MGKDFRKHIYHYYGRAANRYDNIEFIRKGTRIRAIKMSSLQPGEKILDVCTGTGDLALAFAQAGARVTGIDIVDNMLLRAQQKTNGHKACWLNMDATHLQFPDKSFDVTTISLALHHMPEETQIQVLTEVCRVTKRCVILIEPHQPFNTKLHWLWGIVGSLVDESQHMREWVRQDLSATCRKANLKVVEIAIMTLAIHRLTVCEPMV